MPFPEAIAKAQRGSFLQDVIEALDITEALHRRLQEVEPHLVALDADTFSRVRAEIAVAYKALAEARNQIGDAS